MDRRLQIVMDAASPRALGTFWASALGYVEDRPPPGYDTWEEALVGWGLPRERWDDAYAIVDPEGVGPRVFFQKVPEPRAGKNRLHLDVGVPGGPDAPGAEKDKVGMRAHAARLVEVGARVVREYDDPDQGFWITMEDPEGNVFDVV
ncbi:VOC family protein [Actinotalea sp. AC32]|nr:VOC family protein [Actinotalea sp. AC32]